jgi:hypothetical protein
MSERATPETDANSERDFDGIDSCDASFARKLERERDEAREELAEYKASSERARDVITQAFLRVAKERDEARELARELRDILECCREDSIALCGEWQWKRDAGIRNERDMSEIDWNIERADSLIAKAKEVLP